MKKLSFLLILFIMLFVSPKATCQATSNTDLDYTSNYQTTLFNATNGLNSNEITSIAQTSDDYIWAGSYAGLYRYDGSRFSKYNIDSRITSVTTLYADARGQLWIGTNNNGLARYNLTTKRITFYDRKDGLPSNSIRCITEDAQHNIYVGTLGQMAIVTPAYAVHSIPSTDSITCVNDLAYSVTSDYVAGITNEGTLFYIKDQKIIQKSTYAPENGEYFNSISATNKDIFIIGTSSNTTCTSTCTDDIILFPETYENKEITNVNKIIITDNTNEDFLICSNNGLGHFDKNQNYQSVTINDFDNSIIDGFVDKQGNVWLASSKQGICKISKNPFSSVLKRAGIDKHVVNSVLRQKDLLYVGTESGLLLIDEATHTQVESDLTLFFKNIRVQHIMNDSNNNIWISTYGKGGLYCLAPSGELTSYNEDCGTMGGIFSFTLELSDGTILAASNTGLTFIKNRKITRTIGQADGLTMPQILSAYETEDGIILLGSDGDGLYQIRDNACMKVHSSNAELNVAKVNRIIPIKNGTFYVTLNAIYYDNGKIIEKIKNLPEGTYYDIQVTNNDYAWIFGSNGLYAIPLYKMLEDKTACYALFNKDKGFDVAISSNPWNTIYDNTLYICCNADVKECNLNEILSTDKKIKIDISRILTDGNQEILPDGQTYTIPANAMRISIQPALLDYTLSNPLVHTYLEGFDETGLSQNRSDMWDMNFTNLSSGTYRFHIQILDEITRNVIQEKIITIEKKPKFYEHTYFKVYLIFVCLMVIVFFTWIISKSGCMSIIRRQMEETQIARTEAERANAAKSQFLANMSHEIRTPINAIMGMNELILRQDTSSEIEKYASDIRSASNSLLSIVNDILDFSKIESGKMNIVCANYETIPLFADVANMLQVKAKEKNLLSKIILDEHVPKILYGDDTRIKQVLLNLLSNAVKYTDHGTVTFRVKVLAQEDNTISLKFSVSDTGMGIKENEIPKLFEVFERLDEKKNSKIQGTGLGLNITKQLLFLMGSHIDVESEYGKGSVFSFVLRQRIIDTAPIGNVNIQSFHKHEHTTYAPSFSAPEGRILIVDDNEMNLTVIRGLLQQTNIQIDTAISGRECLDMIQKKHFDIIFLDHMMPEMDGIETLEQIQKMDHQCKDVPVIVLTANAVLGAKEMYLEKGFIDYLSKPITGKALESMIRKHLPKELLKPVSVMPEDTPIEKIAPVPDSTPKEHTFLLSSHEIDKKIGMSYCSDMESLYNELVQMFIDLGPEKKTELTSFLEHEDCVNYEIAVHALKSTAKSIGAVGLSEYAKDMEFAAKDGKLKFLQERHNTLMKYYQKVIDEGKSLLGIPKDRKTTDHNLSSPASAHTSKTDIGVTSSDADMTAKIDDLKEAVYYFDDTRAQKLLDELLLENFPLREMSILEKLQFAIKNSDWDKAQTYIEKL